MLRRWAPLTRYTLHRITTSIMKGLVWIRCNRYFFLYSLLLLSADRFLAVMFPLQYPSIMTSRRARIALGAVWFCSMIVGFLPIVDKYLLSYGMSPFTFQFLPVIRPLQVKLSEKNQRVSAEKFQGGGQRKKQGRKIAPISLLLLYQYHV